MRVPVLSLLLLIGVVTWSSESRAEKVRINQNAKLFARMGEQSKVLVKLKSGDKVNLLAKEGRWLKVRTQGRTGWIPRSKADISDDDEGIARNTRRRPFVDGRSTSRGSLGDAGPDDRVGEDATGGGDDDDDAKPPRKVVRGGGGGGDDDDDDDDDDVKPPSKGGKPPKVVGRGNGNDDADDDDAADADADADEDVKVEDNEPKRRTVRVASRTKVYEEQDKDSDEKFTATPDTTLYLSGSAPGKKWTEVENDEGDLGYVLTSQLDLSEDGDAGAGGARKRTIDLRVRGGVTIITQGLRTAGGAKTVPDNYNVGVSAATLAVGGAYLMPYKKDFVIGVDLAYAFQKALPGVRYKDPTTQAATTTSFTVHDLGIKLVGGYDLHKRSGLTLLGRAGLRYNSFQVADVGVIAKNPATIPSEIQISPTIGGGVAVPRLTPKLGLRIVLDAFLIGTSIQQTKGLEDGATPSARGVNLGAMLNYGWKPGLDIQATYDLNFAAVEFGAPVPTSLRNHMGTSVSRTDIFHMLTVGISKGF